MRDNQFDKALENNHTLATVLDRAGYATVAIGKWGLQGEGPGETIRPPGRPFRPNADSTPFFRLRPPCGWPRTLSQRGALPEETKEVWDGTNNITPDLDKCYTADLWTAWAKHWIVKHEQSTSGPAILHVSGL